MKKQLKKLLGMLLVLGMSLESLACMFTIKNDSEFKTIYVVTDPKLANSEVISAQTLNKAENVYKSVKDAKTPQTNETKIFYIYTPAQENNGLYERSYRVEMKFCGHEKEDNILTYKNIAANNINTGRNKDRFEIIDFTKNETAAQDENSRNAQYEDSAEAQESQYEIERQHEGQPEFIVNPGGYPLGTLP